MDFGVRGSLGVSPAVLESVFRGLDLSPPTAPGPLHILTVPASSLYQPATCTWGLQPHNAIGPGKGQELREMRSLVLVR